MSRFKVGDLVTPVNGDRYNDIMKQLVCKTLLVRSVCNDTKGDEIVLAGIPGEEYWFWNPDNLRLLAGTDEPQGPKPSPEPTDPAPAATRKPKPIRRGDLVMCHGVLWVVHSEGEGSDGDYWIASLTGDPETHYATIDELTRVGSIRKKIKRMKAQFVGDEK